jgi:hypothetical protein
MNTDKLLNLIEKTLVEVQNYGMTHNAGKSSIVDTKKVLNLLKAEIVKDAKNINERVLRAMHDIGMSSYKEFENTPLENAIGAITSLLYDQLPFYKTLTPLRDDFGKDFPI